MGPTGSCVSAMRAKARRSSTGSSSDVGGSVAESEVASGENGSCLPSSAQPSGGDWRSEKESAEGQ